MSYAKPLPELGDEVNGPYWEAARAHRLEMPVCNDCGHRVWYPRRFCPVCWSDDMSWVELSGEGRLWTFTEIHVPFYDETWADDVPYVVVVVELEEGPRMLSNLVEPDVESLAIGDRVHVVFDDVTPDVTLPRFRVES